MSKPTYTRPQVEEALRQLAYFSSQHFTGGSINLTDGDFLSSGKSEMTSFYSELLGRVLTTLEIALTGKQLEAAKSQVRESFSINAERFRIDYETYVKNSLFDFSDNTNKNLPYMYGEHTPGGTIQKILNPDIQQ